MGSSVTLTGDEATAVAGLLGVSLTMIAIFSLVIWVLCIIARWRIFTKAGEAGWKSIIPIYSDYVQWRIGWKKTGLFWAMLALIIVGAFMVGFDGSFVSVNGSLTYTGSGGILGTIGIILMLVAAILDLVSIYKLFASFGKGIGWFIGYIFLSYIMLLVLGLGSSRYYGAQD